MTIDTVYNFLQQSGFLALVLYFNTFHITFPWVCTLTQDGEQSEYDPQRGHVAARSVAKGLADRLRERGRRPPGHGVGIGKLAARPTF